MKIMFKIISGFLLVILVIMVGAYIAIVNSQEALVKVIGENQLIVAKGTMSIIDRTMYGVYQDIQIIAENDIVEEIFLSDEEKDHFIREFEEFLSLTGPWEILFLVDNQGEIIASTLQEEIGDSIFEEQFQNQEAFQNALKEGVYYSDVFVSSETGNPSILFSAPVRDESTLDENILGVVIGVFKWKTVTDILETLDHADVMLLNNQGMGISEGKQHHIDVIEGLLSEKVIYNITDYINRGDHNEIHEKGIDIDEEVLSSVYSQRGHLEYEGNGWILILDTRVNEAFIAVDNLKNTILIVTFVVIIISIFFAFFVSRSVSKPLTKLSDGAKIIGEGKLNTKIEITSNDEIKDLADSFNQMAVNLNQSQLKLRKYSINLEGEVKKRTAELKESEEQFKSLFESSRDAIMILEPPEWRFTKGNPATLEMFKAKSKEEFVNKGPWNVSPKKQPDGQLSSKKAKRMIMKAMKEGSNFFEWRHKRLSGEEFPATVLLTKFNLRGKDILQATVRDVTELKKNEENLKQAYHRLKSLDRAKDQFVSLLSHELKSPLIPIMGYSEMMTKGELGVVSKDQKEALEVMHRNAENLNDLVNDFLDLSRLDLERVKLNFKNYDLIKIFHEVKENLSEFAKKNKATIKIIGPSTLILKTDQLRANQIITNLVKNAIQYGRKEKENNIEIVVDTSEKFVNVAVKDQGQGIYKENISKLFNRFFRAEQAVSSPTTGTGLGLVITKGLIELLGGEIKVESKKNVGSIFSFTLPLVSKVSIQKTILAQKSLKNSEELSKKRIQNTR